MLQAWLLHAFVSLTIALDERAGNSGPVYPSNSKLSFTEWLRKQAGRRWERIVEHKFTEELAAGTLDRKVLATYLLHDHRFVDSRVVLLASMIAAAPSLTDRISGAQFLGHITSKESAYFERAFEELDLSADSRRKQKDEDVTIEFGALTRRVAQSQSFGRMLAVLLAIEWSCLSWGERISPLRAPELPSVFGEWIDLHSSKQFASVVTYLRRLLDREGPTLNKDEQNAMRDDFLEAVEFEDQIFDMAFSVIEKDDEDEF